MWGFIVEHPTIFSGFSAFLALLFSIFVYFRTRKLMKPSEKPIIVIFRQVIFEKQKEVALEFKNIGGHAATDINLKCGSSLYDQPESFEVDKDSTYVNPAPPDGTFSIHYPLFIKKDMLVYLLFTYRDVSNPKKKYASEFWFTYKQDTPTLRDQTTIDQLKLLPFVEKQFPQRRKLLIWG